MKIEEFIPPKPHSALDTPRDTSQMVIAGPRSLRRASKKVLSDHRKKKNPFINFGSNRQNVAEEIREVWIADSKSRNGRPYKLLHRDQGGADALIVAYLCRQGRYRELFQNGIKPHAYLALQFFPDAWKQHINPEYIDIALNTEIKDLKNLEFWKKLINIIKDSDTWEPKKRYYFFGKKTGHSGNYGMKGEKLASSILEETEGEIVLDTGTCDRWLYNYHGKLFPEIQRDFQFGVMSYAKKHKLLRNIFGWPYYLTGRDVDKLSVKDLNELYSWIPQSTVACITLMALVEFQEYIEENDKDWHILQETHDSITVQCPDNEAEECGTILGSFMKREMVSPVDGVKFKMGSSCAIGDNWAKKVVKPDGTIINPNGLEEVNL